MKYLFVFAHPDDEVVGSGGTIKRLTKRGHQVRVVLATNGGASEKATGRVREKEFALSGKILGVERGKILGFKDGEINNKLVWGELEESLVKEIEEFEPEVVVSFEPSGWYYHLDHVGVSIATLRAARQKKRQVKAMLLNWFRPRGMEQKWPYSYPPFAPSHKVEVGEVREDKIRAIEAHKSQDLDWKRWGEAIEREFFQLAWAEKEWQKAWEAEGIFEPLF